MAIASFVLGILALLCAIVPLLGAAFGVLAMGLGSARWLLYLQSRFEARDDPAKEDRWPESHKTMAIMGTVFGFGALVLNALVTLIVLFG